MANGERAVPAEPGGAGWFERMRRSRLGLALATVAVLVTAVAGVTDSLNTIGVWLNLRPDALDVSGSGEKEKFSRELVRSIWEQLYWSRKVLDLHAQVPPADPAERDKAWDRYRTIVDDWNRDLMVNVMSLQQYYGSAKRAMFERDIQPNFQEIDSCLAAIAGRRTTARWRCASDRATPSALDRFIEKFSKSLYCFATGLPELNESGGCAEKPRESPTGK